MKVFIFIFIISFLSFIASYPENKGLGSLQYATRQEIADFLYSNYGMTLVSYTSFHHVTFPRQVGYYEGHRQAALLCGAEGGTSIANSFNNERNPGGYGGCVLADLNASHGDILWFVIGAMGRTSDHTTSFPSIYNGGGSSGGNPYCGASGGGATDIRLSSTDLNSRIMVAGGGGGGGGNSNYQNMDGGDGGTYVGEEGGVYFASWVKSGGGSQSAGGNGGGTTSYRGSSGSFGNGGAAASSSCGGGGGGGYFGGGGGYWSGGGGGSNYYQPGTIHDQVRGANQGNGYAMLIRYYYSPTATPTHAPTYTPTYAPSHAPTSSPTDTPTYAPSHAPTSSPTYSPTYAPSHAPTSSPTDTPTYAPSHAPTSSPTDTPTHAPSQTPTSSPTDTPTYAPSHAPTSSPTYTPTYAPSHAPTSSPTDTPTYTPSHAPTSSPTDTPTYAPSHAPTSSPTYSPTYAPTSSPTDSPTYVPSRTPSSTPTSVPSGSPTLNPTVPLCAPGDRHYCSDRGYCDDTGNNCVCDDYLHYWPSEQCSTWHNGRELEEGWYCYPNTTDQYCSWMGICASDGQRCECFGGGHRTSADRCSTWYLSYLAIGNYSGVCLPDDREYCNRRGYCNAEGDGCVCDDYLHYWPSEQCSTWHEGRELPSNTSCCYPNSTDYYCSWLGTCDSTGSYCMCDDSAHRLPSERCYEWHYQVDTLAPTGLYSCPTLITPLPSPVPTPRPSTFPTYFPTGTPIKPTSTPSFTPSRSPTTSPSWSPTASPSQCPTWNPTKVPSALPSFELSESPTGIPTHTPVVCLPGDRDFCNNKGRCDDLGHGCECDDYLHFWPSEQCSTWHNGRELKSGLYCYPGTVDYYCSWLGTCASDGTSCECEDSLHRTSDDRCATWSPAPPVPSPAPVPGPCTPGDRSHCFNKGVCDSSGLACICDDDLHYWPSELCETFHLGPEVVDDQCCYPDARDYYCGWVGVCNSDGTECICDDPDHRLPSERCQFWHDVLPATTLMATQSGCPATSNSDNEGSGNSGDSVGARSFEYFPYVLTVACLLLFVGGVLVYRRSQHETQDTDRNTACSEEFMMTSPMKREYNIKERESTFDRIRRSSRLSNYEHVEDEMEGVVPISPDTETI